MSSKFRIILNAFCYCNDPDKFDFKEFIKSCNLQEKLSQEYTFAYYMLNFNKFGTKDSLGENKCINWPLLCEFESKEVYESLKKDNFALPEFEKKFVQVVQQKYGNYWDLFRDCKFWRDKTLISVCKLPKQFTEQDIADLYFFNT